MSKEIYNSEHWIVRIRDNGEVDVSYFEDGHYCSEIILKVNANGLKVIRSDDESERI